MGERPGVKGFYWSGLSWGAGFQPTKTAALRVRCVGGEVGDLVRGMKTGAADGGRTGKIYQLFRVKYTNFRGASRHQLRLTSLTIIQNQRY